MSEKLDKHILRNGMVILGEPLAAVGSAAFGFMLPAGAALLPDGCCGVANVIADWLFRGAGDKDSRQLGDALDSLGLHRAGSISSSHILVGAVLEAGNLAEALDLYAEIILKASLQDDQFELARQLVTDAVLALDDDPRQKVMLKLRELFYPEPLGRNIAGDIDELKVLTAEKTRQIIRNSFNFSQTILSVAGKYDFDAVVTQMENLFANGAGQSLKPLELIPQTARYTHIENDGAQVHIGLMTETVKPAEEDYYNARVAVSVLSGGMSARLFTEVREKRGLCYAIGAKYHALKEAAGIACYAGTTPEKAQQTLDVITAEFNRLSNGIGQEEIERAKTGLKASLIMSSESSSVRASGIGSDQYILGRVRSLEEIKNKIEETTAQSVLEFLTKYPFKDFTVVTIGPRKVTV
jgi:predicted Zn-dependent peptidase